MCLFVFFAFTVESGVCERSHMTPSQLELNSLKGRNKQAKQFRAKGNFYIEIRHQVPMLKTPVQSF